MKTADDHELKLAFAAVELGAESGVATIMTGKSQSGSRKDVDGQRQTFSGKALFGCAGTGSKDTSLV